MSTSAFKTMFFFYGAVVLVPFMLWVIAITSPYPQYHTLRVALAALSGIGAIIYGIIGFNEVFHG